MSPGGILDRRHRQILIAVIEAGPVRPARSARPVLHIVHLVGADGNVDVRAFILQYVLHAAPLGTVPAVLGPDESLVRLDAAEFLSILNPDSVVSTILLDVGFVWHNSLVEHREMKRHG